MVTDFIGWAGAGLLLIAYATTLSGKKLSGGVFHAVNLLGAMGIAVSSLEKSAYPAASLNGVWSIVAFIGVVRWVLNHRVGTPINADDADE